MRTRCLILVLSALLLAAPAAHPNNSNLPPGTRIEFVGTGKTKAIKITGTQGCTFEVAAVSSDEKVATVTFDAGIAKKSHTIVVEGVGFGTTDITITTSNGSLPQCQGFVFNYPVTVDFDQKAFLKNGKALLADSLKDAKTEGNLLLDDYCVAVGEIAADFADGAIEALDAFDAATFALGDFSLELDALLDGLYEQAWQDLWSDSAQYVAPGTDVLSFYPGACGQWDKFHDKLNALDEKLMKAATKKLKSLESALVKAVFADDDDALLVIAEFPQVLLELDEPVPPMGAAPGPVLPDPPAKDLQKTWTSAGRLRSSPTSNLQVGGQADPGAGDVTVTLTGSDGFTTQTTASVGADCKWMADFSGLDPGPYTVTLTQGTNGPVGFGVQVP